MPTLPEDPDSMTPDEIRAHNARVASQVYNHKYASLYRLQSVLSFKRRNRDARNEKTRVRMARRVLFAPILFVLKFRLGSELQKLCVLPRNEKLAVKHASTPHESIARGRCAFTLLGALPHTLTATGTKYLTRNSAAAAANPGNRSTRTSTPFLPNPLTPTHTKLNLG